MSDGRNRRNLLLIVALSAGCLLGMCGLLAVFANAMSSSHDYGGKQSLVGVARLEGRFVLVACRTGIGEARLVAGEHSDGPTVWHAKLREDREGSSSLPILPTDDRYDIDDTGGIDEGGTYSFGSLSDQDDVNLLFFIVPFQPGAIGEGQVFMLNGQTDTYAVWQAANGCIRPT
jgi:hypothetical protein